MDINELIENVGSEEVRLEIVNRLYPLIVSSINRYCPVRDEFDDLVQDGRVIVLECIELYDRSKGHFLNFVKVYLKYYYLDTFKYLIKYDNAFTDEEMPDVADNCLTEESLEFEESCGELFCAIVSLPKRQRRVVELYFFDGLSHAEIASRLGIKKKTVINLKFKALANLRGIL